jgi:hypothetical protein
MPVDNANVRLSQWKSTIPVQLPVLDYMLHVHCYRIVMGGSLILTAKCT